MYPHLRGSALGDEVAEHAQAERHHVAQHDVAGIDAVARGVEHLAAGAVVLEYVVLRVEPVDTPSETR